MAKTITVQQAAQYAVDGGFTGDSVAIIVAIAQAESSLQPKITHLNTDGSIDRGILQINSVAHAEVPDTVAFDPAQAFQAAYTISSKGTNFHPWTTYDTGEYLKYLDKGMTNGNQFTLGAWSEAKAQHLWPWLFPLQDQPAGRISNHWDGQSEYGIDLQEVLDTPITSLTYGKCLNTFYYGGGGVAVIQSSLRGHGTAAVYYQHLDLITVKTGDTVKVGDIIGYSGGQLQGGTHPATKQYSSGPHIEVGVNCASGYRGYMAMGPNFDPLPWLQELTMKGPPPTDTVVSSYTFAPLGNFVDVYNHAASGTGPIADNFTAMFTNLDEAMQFGIQNFVVKVDLNNPITLPFSTAGSILGDAFGVFGTNAMAFLLRAMFLIIGFLLLLAGIWQLISGTVTKAAPLIEAGAVAAAAP